MGRKRAFKSIFIFILTVACILPLMAGETQKSILDSIKTFYWSEETNHGDWFINQANHDSWEGSTVSGRDGMLAYSESVVMRGLLMLWELTGDALWQEEFLRHAEGVMSHSNSALQDSGLYDDQIRGDIIPGWIVRGRYSPKSSLIEHLPPLRYNYIIHNSLIILPYFEYAWYQKEILNQELSLLFQYWIKYANDVLNQMLEDWENGWFVYAYTNSEKYPKAYKNTKQPLEFSQVTPVGAVLLYKKTLYGLTAKEEDILQSIIAEAKKNFTIDDSGACIWEKNLNSIMPWDIQDVSHATSDLILLNTLIQFGYEDFDKYYLAINKTLNRMLVFDTNGVLQCYPHVDGTAKNELNPLDRRYPVNRYAYYFAHQWPSFTEEDTLAQKKIKALLKSRHFRYKNGICDALDAFWFIGNVSMLFYDNKD